MISPNNTRATTMTTTYVNYEIDGKTENNEIKHYFNYINCRASQFLINQYLVGYVAIT